MDIHISSYFIIFTHSWVNQLGVFFVSTHCNPLPRGTCSELCHVNAPQTSLGPHSPSHHLQLPCTACSRHFSSFWNASRHFFMMKEFFFFLSFFLSSANIQRGTGGALASLSWRSSRLFLGEQRVQQETQWGFQHVPTPFFVAYHPPTSVQIKTEVLGWHPCPRSCFGSQGARWWIEPTLTGTKIWKNPPSESICRAFSCGHINHWFSLSVSVSEGYNRTSFWSLLGARQLCESVASMSTQYESMKP